ncbi:hypothetical protein Gotri_027180, partial [Gossypium trilobum]|nr:hypothetical protein [Gossypium trilobum]
MKRSSYSNLNYEIPSLPLHTSKRIVLIERKGTPRNRSNGDEVGPIAQKIRARGYEPRCREFESLLAHNRPKREGPFPLG